MQKVSSIAEAAEVTSQGVLLAADEVARTAGTLRGEVESFLAAMANSNESDRRRYERIDGSGHRAKMRVPGRNEAEMVIQDISRSGIALVCDFTLPVGTEVGVGLPGGTGDVTGRVARIGHGIVAITFRQDNASLQQVDHALDTIARRALSKAA
jgi:hypothetical protein